jgi:phosphoribosylglycinamide formyltransferase-1
MGKLRLGVLLSGSGRTLQNLIDLIGAGELPAEIAVVISDQAGVKGLERATGVGLKTVLIRRKGTPPEQFNRRITEALRSERVELVCLAGFLSLWRIPPDFEGRVMNIHPALLPRFGGAGFYGHHVHQAVLDAGCKTSGCTVHFADNEYDHGPIIMQWTVPVLEGDDADSLADRVFEQELIAYPEAIRLFAAGRLRIDGRRVHILPDPT